MGTTSDTKSSGKQAGLQGNPAGNSLSINGFASRHIGVNEAEVARMLEALGQDSLQSLIEKVVPQSIRDLAAPEVAEAVSENQALLELGSMASTNTINRSMIGQGYYDCHTPPVLQRNVFENPGWYTAYTPYQPEIAQGRLEVLFNFQTMITELTGMAIANASLLDEATAAAEAMAMAHRAARGKKNLFLVADNCHPQTLDVIRTRAEPLDIQIETFDCDELIASGDAGISEDCFSVLFQYPGTAGEIPDASALAALAHAGGAQVIVATDLLALMLLQAPAEWGADIVVGSAQRFGVPMGFGGPHAAFMATTDKLKRSLPGRLVGQSLDSHGNPAYRLALQTREQHIRREKATSNICTAQALLAIMATLYVCYHGPQGLRQIALRTHAMAVLLRNAINDMGLQCSSQHLFDTVTLTGVDAGAVIKAANQAGINVRQLADDSIAMACDETTTFEDIASLVSVIAKVSGSAEADCAKLLKGFGLSAGAAELDNATAGQVAEFVNTLDAFPAGAFRSGEFLSQPCFHDYHSETEMMRYLRLLADRDIALDRAMIPLGSCTMKLNAAAEMMPVSWPAFANIHPFAPQPQTPGYRKMIAEVESMLCACTGYAAVSLQPNAGSQGEYAGLLAISRYHAANGDTHRDVCLIPESAHGTNPASAQMAGMKVVVVACDEGGNVDIEDLQAKIDAHSANLAAIMITYPSTHGVFEAKVGEVCQRVHDAGGQVYIDGANLNAMVGVAKPGRFGGDVSHLNLHKTFCIPHGGGGPGVGPVAVAEHLAPYLPGHAELDRHECPVSAAPWGSAMILPITWMYIRMMGGKGLQQATEIAILNANYMASRLSTCYPILYTGEHGFVAHECILDTRVLKDMTGISVDDIAKRLMDFGFHAPTMSFPVAGTLMIEPTESESLAEIDRFCDAMLQIHAEISKVADGSWSLADNPLVNAPHTAPSLMQTDWPHVYSREEAAYPQGVSSMSKYWPPVGRIDNVYGDKNLVCSCPPLSDYVEA